MSLPLVVAIAGWAGVAMILAAYVLLSLERIAARSVAYQALNFFGAIGFVINSGWNGAVPSAALNVVWAGIALYAWTRIARSRRTVPERD